MNTRRPGESEESYRRRVEEARRRRGLTQLPLPLESTEMNDLEQKVIKQDGSVEDVRITTKQYNESVDEFTTTVMVAAFAALHEANPDGYFVRDGVLYARLADGTTPSVKISVALDTD